MTTAPRLATDRLLLLALSADAIDALIRRDRAQLQALTGATFPEPLAAPPLMDDAMPYMRHRLRVAPADIGWWPWLIVVAATGEAVGALGLAGRPGDNGIAVLGYALYPAAEGHGYATEASRALIGWALRQPGVQAVHATIPVGHTPSLNVATRLGMQHIGAMHDNEAGEIAVYETRGELLGQSHSGASTGTRTSTGTHGRPPRAT